MNSNDFVSIDHLIAEVTVTVNDAEFKGGFSKGWYQSRIQDALQELSFDTFWLKVTHDFVIPENCRIPMPANVFNLREIYLYSGEFCNPVNTQNVYWKRLFDNSYSGKGYTAKVKDDGSNSADIYQPNQRALTHNMQGFYGPKFYYNISDDLPKFIMLSRECLSFPYLRMRFNGMGVPNGDLPIVPRFFERAVVDYVKMKFYDAMKSRDPRVYRALWSDAKDDVENLITGSWNKAKKRIKSMDTAEKESMEEYISSMYHK
jgi:hypothetical protein